MFHRTLRFPWENRFAEKRGFQLAHTAFGGVPGFRPTGRTPYRYEGQGTGVSSVLGPRYHTRTPAYPTTRETSPEAAAEVA